MNLETLVMLDIASKKAIPINIGLFLLAQFSREKKLNKKYKGNLVIYPSGDVKEIAHIKILGYFGESFFKKIFSILNSTFRIDVQLTECKESFHSIKEKAITFIKNDQESDDPFMPIQDENMLVKSNIESIAQLYSMLKLPNPEDALDVMV